MHFNDALDNCKADACPFSCRIQLVEKAEDPFMKIGLDADAIVADEEDGFAILNLHTDGDHGFRLVAHELGGVIDQVLHHLYQAGTVTIYHRQVRGNLYAHLVGR